MQNSRGNNSSAHEGLNGRHLVIRSIQPLGTGTEVRLPAERPVVEAAPHCGAVTSAGVPQELVGRFLGRTFSREELEQMRARFLDDQRIVYQWQGQGYFLEPD